MLMAAKWFGIISLLIGWFGFALPAAVSANSTILCVGAIGITAFAGLYLAVRLKAHFTKLLILCFAGIMFTACSRVEPGHVGLIINKAGSDRGVQMQVKGPGNYFLGWNEDLYIFPTFQQTYNWVKDTSEGSKSDESIIMGTSDGMDVNLDIGVTYHVETDSVPVIFTKYRKGIDEITQTVIRNSVRRSLNRIGSQTPVDSLIGHGRIRFMDSINNVITHDFDHTGIVIEQVSMLSRPRLPEELNKAINEKIKAIQDAQTSENQVASVRAQYTKDSINATSIALQNTIKARSLTPEVIRMLELDNTKRWIDKWNGTPPTYYSGSNSNMLFQLPSSK